MLKKLIFILVFGFHGLTSRFSPVLKTMDQKTNPRLETNEERENEGNGGANEASDHEAVEGRRRWEAEDQSGSVKNRRHRHQFRNGFFLHCYELYLLFHKP